MENLLALQVSREPLEAHHLTGLDELLVTAYRRACFVIPSLVDVSPEDETLMLESLNGLLQAVHTLGDQPELRDLRVGAFEALAATTGGSAAMRGGVGGLLHSEGVWTGEQLVHHLRGHLHSTREEGVDGPNYLRGQLKTARSSLWQVPECLAALHEVLSGWEETRFIKLLPMLRLSLADLTPRETDVVAKSVARMLGAESLQVANLTDVAEAELFRAVEVNRLVRDTLVADGLEAFYE
jgi:hypothetical protein